MSEIKAAFPSRFEGGVLLESDFSQLEVIGLAMLTMDEQLIQDLLDGKDMHRFFAAQLYGITEEEVTAKQRKLVKRLTFALQYGSGAQGLANKNGISKELAQEFIDNYYGRYWRVKDWQEEVRAIVEGSREDTDRLTKAGYVQGKGTYESPTGRRYTFLEQDAPDWKKDKTPNFSPTAMKNYAVQGTATADIMAVFRGQVLRDLVAAGRWNTCLPINTVHDSVMFDCATMEDAMFIKRVMEKRAEGMVASMQEIWSIHCPVPFKIETKIGPRWSEMEVVPHG